MKKGVSLRSGSGFYQLEAAADAGLHVALPESRRLVQLLRDLERGAQEKGQPSLVT